MMPEPRLVAQLRCGPLRREPDRPDNDRKDDQDLTYEKSGRRHDQMSIDQKARFRIPRKLARNRNCSAPVDEWKMVDGCKSTSHRSKMKDFGLKLCIDNVYTNMYLRCDHSIHHP